MAACWNNDPRQGSAFHELVVLPTIAPQLARPYYAPGTPEYHAAEAARRQEAMPAENPGLSFIPALYFRSLTIVKGALAGGNPEGHSDVVPAVPTSKCQIMDPGHLLNPHTGILQ